MVNFQPVKSFCRVIGLFILIFQTHLLLAQDDPKENASDTDSIQINRDSLAINQSEIEFIIEYKASDSIRFDVTKQVIHLYNDANINYGQSMNLSAGYILIDQTSGSVEAVGIEDQEGKTVKEPIFKDKNKSYNSKKIKYNFKSQKGIISGTTTREGEGIIRSETVKRSESGDLFAEDNVYIICGECENEPPEIAIHSRKMKIIPGKVTASGPFQMVLYGVPTPLMFPFGLFPQRSKRASGFIMPMYGETRERGFFLSNGGFYWAISDYADMQILGEIYTIGGWGFTVESNYKKRYFHNGNLKFQYNKRVNEKPGSIEDDVQNDFRLQWSHTPESRGDSRFSANVDLASTTFNQNNARRAQDYLSASMKSNITYSKTFTGTPFSFSGNLRHQQNLTTGLGEISPSMSLRMNKIYPFRRVNSKKKNLISELNLSYSGEAKASIKNVIGTGAERDTLDMFNFNNINRLLSNAQKMGARHRIPISTSTSIFKYFNLSVTGSYSESWYPEQYTYTYNEASNTIDQDTLSQFSRFYQFNGGVSTSTQFYGFYYPKFLNIKAVRHLIQPTVGLSYTPDFSQAQWGMYQYIEVADGAIEKKSRYDGIYGSPSQNEAGTISFGLQNTFEMKLDAKETDSIQKDRKVQLLNLNINSGYNLIRPDNGFQLSNFNWTANTRIKSFNFNLSGTINPYAYEITERDTLGNFEVVKQTRIPTYAWQAGKGLGYLESVRFGVNTSFNPKPKNASKREPKNAVEEEILRDFYANPDLYVDFSVPWSLTLSYSLNYRKTGEKRAEDLTQSLTFSGNLSLTPKWKINFNSGYDFENQDLTFTQLSITRDLKCWRMTTTWIPFGPRAGYTFNLGVKSQMFSDLKLERRNSWYFR